MIDIRIAAETDFSAIMELIKQAKEYLKGLNIDQWQDGYPNENIILKDIADRNGYVLTDSGTVTGYVCISFDGDENYSVIEGQWRSEQPYAVIHRITISDECKGKGLSALMFQFTETLCKVKGIHSIKVDTHEKNTAMKHILAKNNYEYCGIIQFRNCERIGFEKII